MLIQALSYTMLAVVAALLGGAIAVYRPPGARMESNVQHFAAAWSSPPSRPNSCRTFTTGRRRWSWYLNISVIIGYGVRYGNNYSPTDTNRNLSRAVRIVADH